VAHKNLKHTCFMWIKQSDSFGNDELRSLPWHAEHCAEDSTLYLFSAMFEANHCWNSLIARSM